MEIEGYWSQQMLDDRYLPVRYHSHLVIAVAVVASQKVRMRTIQDHSTKGHDLPTHLEAQSAGFVLREHASIGWEVFDQV